MQAERHRNRHEASAQRAGLETARKTLDVSNRWHYVPIEWSNAHDDGICALEPYLSLRSAPAILATRHCCSAAGPALGCHDALVILLIQFDHYSDNRSAQSSSERRVN